MNACADGIRDLVIVDTCGMTPEAERQAIRCAHRDRPATRIVVTGCAAQPGPQGWSRLPRTLRVAGPALPAEGI